MERGASERDPAVSRREDVAARFKQLDVYVANQFAVRINGDGGVKVDELLAVAARLRFDLLTDAAGASGTK